MKCCNGQKCLKVITLIWTKLEESKGRIILENYLSDIFSIFKGVGQGDTF